jgi:hypothetical protein
MAMIVSAVYRGWQYAMKTRTRHTTNDVASTKEQSTPAGTLLIESDIRDGVRGIMP